MPICPKSFIVHFARVSIRAIPQWKGINQHFFFLVLLVEEGDTAAADEKCLAAAYIKAETETRTGVLVAAI